LHPVTTDHAAAFDIPIVSSSPCCGKGRKALPKVEAPSLPGVGTAIGLDAESAPGSSPAGCDRIGSELAAGTFGPGRAQGPPLVVGYASQNLGLS
jgi:hypothetical protein